MSGYQTPYNGRQTNMQYYNNSYVGNGYTNGYTNGYANNASGYARGYNTGYSQPYQAYNTYPNAYNPYYGGQAYRRVGTSLTTKIIFFINMVAFVVCIAYLGNYYLNSMNVQEKQEDLVNLIDGATGTDGGSGGGADAGIDGSTDRYESIRDKYPDLIGRLLFNNYNDVIDLPVMQTKEDPMYYLYRDQDGEKSDWGTPFLDYRCDVETPTDNFVIYAHNMKDLTQFGSLKNYKTKDYWQKYKTVEFETMHEGRKKYEIVASFYTQIYDANKTGVFKYYKFFDAETEADYDDYINGVLKLANYKTGIVPKYGEQLLTMSTCDYTQGIEEGRFVVVARKAQ